MKNLWINLANAINSKKQGQSMVEYLLIISLIAIVVIIAVTNFGDALLDFYTDVKDAIVNL